MTDEKFSFATHLDELRRRVLTAFCFLAVASSVSFYFIENILQILKIPAKGQIETFAVFGPTAAILAFFKVSLTAGLILSVPIFLYEIWMFVLPALEKKHARKGLWFILSGSTLFLVGVLFSFYFLAPASLNFLLKVGKGELELIISLDSYVSFILMLVLGGGIVFEMPVLVFMFSRLGVLTSEKMIRGWRVAIILILITAALITPTPDLFNMCLISLPLFMLYLVSIGVSWVAGRKDGSVRGVHGY